MKGREGGRLALSPSIASVGGKEREKGEAILITFFYGKNMWKKRTKKRGGERRCNCLLSYIERKGGEKEKGKHPAFSRSVVRQTHERKKAKGKGKKKRDAIRFVQQKKKVCLPPRGKALAKYRKKGKKKKAGALSAPWGRERGKRKRGRVFACVSNVS